jgi:hypothetical protein
MAVEGLGAKLAKDPARVAPALRGCKQGADWLRERWEALGEILENQGGWTDEQRRLAYDLLGVPPALRDGSDMLPPPEDVDGLAAVVAARVAGLEEDCAAVLDELDAAERAMAMGGMALEEDAVTARLRKYEGSCRRAFAAAKAELLRLREAEAAAAAQAEPAPSHRAPLTDAAVDYLARRSREANQARAAARLEQMMAAVVEPPAPAAAPVVEPSAPAPVVVERPAAATAPAPSRPTMVPSAAPLNRRERRAQAKRDRQAARRAGR